MSTVLNRLYSAGYQALLQLPLEINDHPTSVEFVNLAGTKITDDGDTEKGDLADPKALFGSPKDPRKNVQVVTGLRSKNQTPGLPPNVLPTDLNEKSGGYVVRGFSQFGARETVSRVHDSVAVSFETGKSAPDVWLGVGTGRLLTAYYLPWKKNHSRVMKLGKAADLFFTSSLTGCTVQVFGNPVAPTVTHTNAGGIQDEKEGQEYMRELLQLYEDTEGSWEMWRDNRSQFDRMQYKTYAERNIDRKLERTDGDQQDMEFLEPPATRSVVVGFRDRGSGQWTFYFQSWVRMHYVKLEQKKSKITRRVKKVIRIKRVGEVWPTPRVIADAWKDVDLGRV
jgi:hypothetical protein